MSMGTELAKTVILKVWSQDQEHQHHRGTHAKCEFSGPTLDHYQLHMDP